MPWSNQPIVASVVIVTSGAPSTGLFVYNGTPQKGTLVAAITAAASTDPFGNSYGAGENFGVWSPVTGAMLNHFGIDPQGRIYLVDASAVKRMIGDSATGRLLFYDTSSALAAAIASVAGHDANLNNYAAGWTGPVSAFQPGVTPTAVETWHPLSLATGWTPLAGNATPSFRLNAVGNVELCGRINNPTTANNTNIATLPAGYFSAVNAYSSACAMISGAAAPVAGQTFRISLGTTGVLGISGIATTGSYTVSLDGVMFPISFG